MQSKKIEQRVCSYYVYKYFLFYKPKYALII
jgi:hypothetical protein